MSKLILEWNDTIKDTMNWKDAMSLVANDKDNWRLPTLSEMITLYMTKKRLIDKTIYWTSTDSDTVRGRKVFLNFKTGKTYSYLKNARFRVLLCRYN